jgi:hypothetical protein
MATVLAFFTSLGILFQSSTVLFEKKFLLTSSLAAWGLKLSGSAALWLDVQFRLPSGTRTRCSPCDDLVHLGHVCLVASLLQGC